MSEARDRAIAHATRVVQGDRELAAKLTALTYAMVYLGDQLEKASVKVEVFKALAETLEGLPD